MAFALFALFQLARAVFTGVLWGRGGDVTLAGQPVLFGLTFAALTFGTIVALGGLWLAWLGERSFERSRPSALRAGLDDPDKRSGAVAGEVTLTPALSRKRERG
jgi:hypothetical protein